MIHGIFVLVGFKNIQNVTFPAVTVCSPNSGKWTSIIKAMEHFDVKGQIFEVVKNQTKERLLEQMYRNSFSNHVKYNLIVERFQPELTLDHKTPEKLNLLQNETEVFYLMHYFCFAKEHNCKELFEKISMFTLASVLNRDTRQQTVEKMKDELCNLLAYDVKYLFGAKYADKCPVLSNTTLIEYCNHSEHSGTFQNWCKQCSKLSGCLKKKSGMSDKMFLQEVVPMIYVWRKYFTHEQLISASMDLYIDKRNKLRKNDTAFGIFDRGMYEWIRNIKPFVNLNITLVDAWHFTNGITPAEARHINTWSM